MSASLDRMKSLTTRYLVGSHGLSPGEPRVEPIIRATLGGFSINGSPNGSIFSSSVGCCCRCGRVRLRVRAGLLVVLVVLVFPGLLCMVLVPVVECVEVWFVRCM